MRNIYLTPPSKASLPGHVIVEPLGKKGQLSLTQTGLGWSVFEERCEPSPNDHECQMVSRRETVWTTMRNRGDVRGTQGVSTSRGQCLTSAHTQAGAFISVRRSEAKKHVSTMVEPSQDPSNQPSHQFAPTQECLTLPRAEISTVRVAGGMMAQTGMTTISTFGWPPNIPPRWGKKTGSLYLLPFLRYGER